MKPLPFEAEVRQEAGIVTIVMHGEVNAFAEKALNLAYTEAQDYNPQVIGLDFSNVSYINSTGIALIVSLLAQARKTHSKLVVYGLSDHYVHIFQITRLADFMSIFPNKDSAMESVSNSPETG